MRSGDVVKHLPSGVEFTVAVVHKADVYPSLPDSLDGRIPALLITYGVEDCVVSIPADDELYEKTLVFWSSKKYKYAEYRLANPKSVKDDHVLDADPRMWKCQCQLDKIVFGRLDAEEEDALSKHRCPRCHRPCPPGSWPFCEDGTGKHGHTIPHGSIRISSIHTSERPVIFRNPRTGDIRYPATKEQPLATQYARQGYVKEHAFTTFSERDQFEKTTGKLHERTHYDPGQPTAERDLTGGGNGWQR